MARINVDDDVESRPEYRRLLKIVGYDDDKALGMLVRFWRVAQKHWGEHRLVPILEIENWDFQPILESRWGIVQPAGVYAIGSETRFAWYRQRCDAGRIGGRPRQGELPDNRMDCPQDGNPELENHAHGLIADDGFCKPKPGETGVNRDEPDHNRMEPDGNRVKAFGSVRIGSENPLVPSPSLVPVPVKKRRNTNTNTLVGIRAEYPTEFDALWKQYGIRGDKKEAFEQYQKLGLQPGELERLEKAIANYVRANPELKFRKHFGGFLKSDWRPYVDAPLSLGNGIHPIPDAKLSVNEHNRAMAARYGLVPANDIEA